MQRSSAAAVRQATRHIPRFGGEIWFVNASGSDNNSGTSPDDAFATIGAAITACSAGDAIKIKAGTYTETGIDVNKEAVELWFEIGALIDPASGTALTVSGASCKVTGMHKITPDAAEIGLLVSGAECHIEHGKVIGGTTGVSITGAGCMFSDYAAGFPSVNGYSITGAQCRLKDCSTVGNASTYGYKINGGADTGVLRGCTSAGHGASGFYVDTLSQDWTLLNCSSGAGDGRWVDTDHANVWSGFSFADEVHKVINMTDATQAFDLFTITGIVQIESLSGQVEEPTNAELGNCQFRLHGTDGATNSDLTTPTDCTSLPAKSAMFKIGDTTIALSVASSAAPFIIENSSFREPNVTSIIGADNTGTTTIQFYSDDAAGTKAGKIDFHCKWAPVSDDGFVTPA